MICASISDLARYKGLSKNLDTAIDWLLKGGYENNPDGQLAIDGDAVYAMFQSYQSKLPAEARFETHRAYIDIQLLLSGEEHVYVRDVNGLKTVTPYTVDIEFQEVPVPHQSHICLLQSGTALILFPEDAHRPGVCIDGKQVACHKVVLKVHV
jgi:YhcH/YjgK/YiaL family protein